jgi:hypothetical protein
MVVDKNDLPDDFQWLPGSNNSPLGDLGELAARIGSPMTFDRRGEVIWMDVCNKGIAPYSLAGSGVGTAVYTSTDCSLHGYYSLVFKAGSTASHNASLARSITTVGIKRSGLEVAYALLNPSERFDVEIAKYDGVNKTYGYVSIYTVLNKILIAAFGGAIPQVAVIPNQDSAYNVFHHVKFVVDFSTGYYVRLMFDDLEYDLSSYRLEVIASALIKQYRLAVYHHGRDTFNDLAVLGHIILTGNEP